MSLFSVLIALIEALIINAAINMMGFYNHLSNIIQHTHRHSNWQSRVAKLCSIGMFLLACEVAIIVTNDVIDKLWYTILNIVFIFLSSGLVDRLLNQPQHKWYERFLHEDDDPSKKTD